MVSLFIRRSSLCIKMYLLRLQLFQQNSEFTDYLTKLPNKLYPWELDTPYFLPESYILNTPIDLGIGNSFFSKCSDNIRTEAIVVKNSLLMVGVHPHPDDVYLTRLIDKNFDYYSTLLLNTIAIPPFYILNSVHLISEIEKLKIKFKIFYQFLIYKWYFDVVYNEIVNRPLLLSIYYVLFSGFDKGMLEVIGPFGISNIIFSSARFVKQTQNGKANLYVYFMIIHLLCLLLVIIYLT